MSKPGSAPRSQRSVSSACRRELRRRASAVCRTAIGAVTVDDVRVPRNATCELNGTFVRGDVKVEANATLRANDVIVIDDIQADAAREVRVSNDSRIGGSVDVKNGGGAAIEDSRVGNNVHYDRNRAAVSLLRSDVDRNVQATRNTGGVESAATRSAATCSARKTARPRLEATTSSTATVRTSAAGYRNPSAGRLARRRPHLAHLTKDDVSRASGLALAGCCRGV